MTHQVFGLLHSEGSDSKEDLISLCSSVGCKYLQRIYTVLLLAAANTAVETPGEAQEKPLLTVTSPM